MNVQGIAPDARWFNIFAMYNQYLVNLDNLSEDYPAIVDGDGIINHEVGHTLGLHHSSDLNDDILFNKDCSDTPKNNNCYALNNPDTDDCDDEAELSNNVMDNNNKRNALSPCQLNIIHRNLAITDYKNRILNDHCEGVSAANTPYFSYLNPIVEDESTMTIPTGTHIVWDIDKYPKGNIEIEPLASLTIKCKIAMPKDGRIIVRRGAKLVVDGGILTYNDCPNLSPENKWHGVEVWGNTDEGIELPHPSYEMAISDNYPNQANQHGMVYLKNGALLEYAKLGITTNKAY